MTALDGSPHGTTETGAAYAEAADRYHTAGGQYEETAGYAVSVLDAIATGQHPQYGETPAQYAQRHLDQMVANGRIKTRGIA